MNNARRKVIQNIMDQLEKLMEDIEAVKDEEQEAYDNLPESIQNSERGEAMDHAIYNLDDAAENVQIVIDVLEDAKE